MKIEICVDHPGAAFIAAQSGADRLELCSALSLGGLTPSLGFMQWCKAQIQIPVHIMIRPRAGSFLYADDELEIMKADVNRVKSLGFEGIVFGILNAANDPDQEKIMEIVSLAKPMTITFHRAFDICRDPFAAMETLISCGTDNILTSGYKEKAIDGLSLITVLVKKAAGRITIMPGSGINDSNIKSIASATGATWFHLSAKKPVQLFNVNSPDQTLIKSVEAMPVAEIDGDMIRRIKRLN